MNLPEPFLDQDHAKHVIEGFLADGKPAVAALLGDLKILVDILVYPKRHDLGSGKHDLLSCDIAKTQGADHDLVDERIARVDVPGMAEDVLELVGGESMFALGRRLQSCPAQEHVRRAVQNVDEREEDVVKDQERRCDPEGNSARALDGQ